jgi:hypothetical protein
LDNSSEEQRAAVAIKTPLAAQAFLRAVACHRRRRHAGLLENLLTREAIPDWCALGGWT